MKTKFSLSILVLLIYIIILHNDLYIRYQQIKVTIINIRIKIKKINLLMNFPKKNWMYKSSI